MLQPTRARVRCCGGEGDVTEATLLNYLVLIPGPLAHVWWVWMSSLSSRRPLVTPWARLQSLRVRLGCQHGIALRSRWSFPHAPCDHAGRSATPSGQHWRRISCGPEAERGPGQLSTRIQKSYRRLAFNALTDQPSEDVPTPTDRCSQGEGPRRPRKSRSAGGLAPAIMAAPPPQQDSSFSFDCKV